jgi:hypothetical protein
MITRAKLSAALRTAQSRIQRDAVSMRPRRTHVVVGGTAIFAMMLAVAFISSRTQEHSVDLESAAESPPGVSSLVQTSERREVVAPEQPAQESLPPPASPSSSSSPVELQNPSLLPRVPNDPHTSLFATERKDPSWSDFTEAQILGEISRLSGLSLVTITVECRTTLCRVQSAFPTADARARQRILSVAATLGLEPRPVVAVSNASRNVVFLAYFGRPKTPTTESQP